MSTNHLRWFTSTFPKSEFNKLVCLFVKNAKSIQLNNSTRGFKQSFSFSSGETLQTRYGMGAPSKAPYINWHVVNIYYVVNAHILHVAIQDDPKREVLGESISSHEQLIKGASVVTIPGKGRAYSYISVSDKLEPGQLDDLYDAFMRLCAEVSTLVPPKELEKWVFGFSKPGYKVPKLSHEERVKMRRGLSSSVRYSVLERDNYSCQDCWRTAKDGVRLHVDHIVPVAHGGNNEVSNLRTLCASCNTRKGGRIAYEPLISAKKIVDISTVIDKAERVNRGISESKRQEILARDDFTCQSCGKTIEDGVRLHIDHTIPVSAGGSNDISNLRTLCQDCNIGKAARVYSTS
ncbi:MAG: HNH endonuclease [Candidatus Microsaccharimonas sp.]